MIADVYPPVQVLLHVRSDRFKAKQFRVFFFRRSQRFHQQRSKRSSQPFVCWNVEADLLPLHDGRRQLGLHQLLEKVLLACPRILKSTGRVELNSTMRWSRKGGRTSTACAMLIRSDFTRMSSGK